MNAATIFLGAGGMFAQSQRMAAIGNNIANSTTTGYKANDLTFAEQLVTHSTTFANGSHNQVVHGVRTMGVDSDWSSGLIDETGDMAHIGIVGDGFLVVQAGTDTRYTRAGDFNLVEASAGSGTYVLQRPNGSLLMGGAVSGSNVSIDGPVTFDALPDSFAIGADGTVTANGATVSNAAIGVQRFANPDALRRTDSGEYQSTTLAGAASAGADVAGENGSGALQQGALERSNVDLVSEFSDLIVTQRAYQANARTITTANEMLQEVINLKR